MDGQNKAGPASLFATHAREGRELPNFVLAPLMSTFDGKTAEVIAIKYGETGYYKTTWGRQSRDWCEEQNERMGINPITTAAYSMCSLFGNWGNYENVYQHIQEAFDKASERKRWTNVAAG